MISKENYEIWMIDYLDGNLTEENKKLFLQFLDLHPNLKDELEDMDKAILTPDESLILDKTDLFKTEGDEMDIPYPEFVAIKEMEEGLNEAEIHWKNIYIQQNKGNEDIFNAYKKTILKTIKTIHFPNKGNLKRVTVAPIFSINTLKRISIAASIAIILSFGSWSIFKQKNNPLRPVAFKQTQVDIEGPVKKDTKKPLEESMTENNANKKIIEERKKVDPEKLQIAKIEHKHNLLQEKDSMNLIAYSAPLNKIQTTKVNAYEVGLNVMMPILIENKLQSKEENETAVKEYISKESERLRRSAKAISGGMKVLGFLSGNNPTFNKVLNEEGEMVAFKMESKSISVSKKIKNIPVTN